jgi:hypothetical protein
VVGSTSRKLGQPLVRQNWREVSVAVAMAALAVWLRRRMRRIALARPVTADVVERVIMGTGIAFSLRLDDVIGRRLQLFGSIALDGRVSGPERGCRVGDRAGASVICEALDRAFSVVR